MTAIPFPLIDRGGLEIAEDRRAILSEGLSQAELEIRLTRPRRADGVGDGPGCRASKEFRRD